MSDIRAESFSRVSPRSWSTVRQRIVEIERDVFGQDAFSPDELRRAFTGPETLAVLLWDGPGDALLVGYTQAQLASDADTFYISNTAIAKSHQGRGLIKTLMERLYADMLMRVHAADILETFDHDSEYGPQRFIRMRVPDPT